MMTDEVTAPLDTDLYLQLEPMVNQVAGQEWKRSHIYSMEDVAQAIWEHVMKNWHQYENADAYLFKYYARRAARAYCMRERVTYMYAHGAFLYTPGMVRRYLEDVVWCNPEDCKDIDARADLTEALSKLTRGQRAAIYKKFALKEPLTKNEQVAESRGVSAITTRLNTGLRLQAGGIEP
jgi:DNA-directed RNA polymerase specialized sigma24 family protein